MVSSSKFCTQKDVNIGTIMVLTPTTKSHVSPESLLLGLQLYQLPHRETITPLPNNFLC